MIPWLLFVSLVVGGCGLLFGQAPVKAPSKTLVTASAASSKPTFDKAAAETYLRRQFMIPANIKILLEDPRPSEVPDLLLLKVTFTDDKTLNQKTEFFVSKDGGKLLQGKVFDLLDAPFAADLKIMKLQNQPSTGPADAPVTIVVFSDFQCQYCREEAKTLRTNLAKEYPTQVRLVFKDFPLDQIHPWARPAAIIGRCYYKLNPGQFWEFHDWIFEQQPSITAETLKTKSVDFGNGRVDTLQLTQCIDGKITESDVDANVTEAKLLAITATPTLFVNGRRLVGNVAWNQLKPVIDYEVSYAKDHPAAKKADEACCEVKVAIPVQK